VVHQREADAVEWSKASSFAALYRTQRLGMVRLAAFLVSDVDLAEDLVQDAFAGLHARWHHLREADRAVAYLRRAVINRSRSTLRRRRTAGRFLWPRPDPSPAADSQVLMADEHHRLRQALAGLPRRQREVLVLRYWADLSEAEIAYALGVSRGTVKSSASRGLDTLETVLDR
jgi:RNA polymerase sigma-70 factor (sigma-E family)